MLPDVTGIDFPTAYQEAVQLSKRVTAGVPWQANILALDHRNDGCPDFYAGVPDDAAVDIDEDAEGQSWFDHCTTAAGTDIDGYAWWLGAAELEGDATKAEGATTRASRSLDAYATVADYSGTRVELKVEASDDLSRTDAPEYAYWTYSSEVSGTVTGSDVFGADPDLPGGWRSDLALYATGGDSQVYEPRGNLFFFGHKLQERFDSVEMDLAFGGAGSLGPDDCALEPRGWIGLRDENAYWYDVVFQPRYDEDVNDTGEPAAPYSECDGCGTIYLRGVEAVELGEVCLDFSFVWSDDPFTPPGVEEFVLTLRQLVSEAP